MQHAEYPTPAKTTVSNSCAPPPPSPQACCGLICFERPNYFCGHLLTDADLTLEQRYFREKNKLYNRSFHGHGIVCGLRLTCDHDCQGGVLISKGYAIDDCGNDLVVCEPMRFPAIDRLREKGYLIEEPPADPCKPEKQPPECKVRQCFYVTFCYEEEQADFTTPFIAGCRSKLTECEPTRVRESVSFDLLDALPEKRDWKQVLNGKLEMCFAVFSKTRFADALQANANDLTAIVNKQAVLDNHDKYCNLLCELRGLLWLYLDKCPDKYNCTLEDEILKIKCPDLKTEWEKEKYADAIQAPFCQLFKLAWRYAISCALSELVPPCSEPAHASCIVLGTVVVENGKLVQVCNCPRSYVWSFTNFFEVFLATTLGELACKEQEQDKLDSGCDESHKHVCCREFEFDCECFLRWVSANRKAPFYAGTEALHFIDMLVKAFQQKFDFTQTCNYSARMFWNMQPEKFAASTEHIEKYTIEPPLANLLGILESAGLGTTKEPLIVTLDQQGVVTGAFVEQSNTATRVKHLEDKVAELQERLQNPPQGKTGDTVPSQGGEGEPGAQKRSRGKKGEPS
jgi:hypothetical protein